VNRLQFEAIEGHSITLDLDARRHLPVISRKKPRRDGASSWIAGEEQTPLLSCR
jgi:hypothetical protein